MLPHTLLRGGPGGKRTRRGRDALGTWLFHSRATSTLLRVMVRALADLAVREPAAAVPIYERALEIDPLREPLYQGLMRCPRQLRQPAEGLRVYRRWRDLLQRELGVAPSPATEALHAELRAAG